MFLILPLVVSADCESDFKTIEKEFKISYKYNSETTDFDIILVNPNYERYSYVFYKSNERNDLGNADRKITEKQLTITIKHYKGTEYAYKIVALYDGCKNTFVKEGKMLLGESNPYAESQLCEGYEEFVLCQKEYDKQMDEATFKSRLEAYKESKESEKSDNLSDDGKKTIEGIKDIFDIIVEFVEEYTIEVIIVAIFIVVLIIMITLLIIRSIKSRRLE